MRKKLTVPAYYAGKNVFITGGTGFMGKVLIEKLLRSCPDIGKIYLLTRPKRNKTKEDRVQEIINAKLFDQLKIKSPGMLEEKLMPLLGDVTQLNLGLAQQDRDVLIENVAIVFHVAASVRFSEPIRDAILMNTRGTREICYLAIEMKKIEVFLYVSTTYSNADRKVVGEKLYEAHGDWREFIEIAENADYETLQRVAPKCLSSLPNTYTFTKSMAEHAVHDICMGKVPTVILRPSIVISTAKEPVKGWVDNYNGPVGIMVGGGKGMMRTIFADPDVKLDYIPVDDAIKGMIMAAWKKGCSNNIKEKSKLSVYNASGFKHFSVSMGQMIDLCRHLNKKMPLDNQLWHANITLSRLKWTFWLKVVFLHILFGFLIDCYYRLRSKNMSVVKLQRITYQTNLALQYYMLNQWDFLHDNFLGLEDELLPQDKPNFSYQLRNLVMYEFFEDAYMGFKKYLLKENMNEISLHKERSRRMKLLHDIVMAFWTMLLIWCVFKFVFYSTPVHKWILKTD